MNWNVTGTLLNVTRMTSAVTWGASNVTDTTWVADVRNVTKVKIDSRAYVVSPIIPFLHQHTISTLNFIKLIANEKKSNQLQNVITSCNGKTSYFGDLRMHVIFQTSQLFLNFNSVITMQQKSRQVLKKKFHQARVRFLFFACTPSSPTFEEK